MTQKSIVPWRIIIQRPTVTQDLAASRLVKIRILEIQPHPNFVILYTLILPYIRKQQYHIISSDCGVKAVNIDLVKCTKDYTDWSLAYTPADYSNSYDSIRHLLILADICPTPQNICKIEPKCKMKTCIQCIDIVSSCDFELIEWNIDLETDDQSIAIIIQSEFIIRFLLQVSLGKNFVHPLRY